MSSEVKLTVQNSVNINTSTGNFKLNLACNNLEGKRELFLSENDDFTINSLNVNIDTNDATDQYENYSNVTLDLTKGEIEYMYENLKNSEDKLEVE